MLNLDSGHYNVDVPTLRAVRPSPLGITILRGENGDQG